MSRQPISVRIPTDLRERMRGCVHWWRANVDEGFSMQQLVERAITEWMARAAERAHRGQPWPKVHERLPPGIPPKVGVDGKTVSQRRRELAAQRRRARALVDTLDASALRKLNAQLAAGEDPTR